MYSFNKTGEWLSNKEPCEQNNLLKMASMNTAVMRKKFKERMIIIKQKKAQDVARKLKLEAQREQRRVDQEIAHTNSVIHWGLWQTEDEIDSNVNLIQNGKEIREGLKAQLRFRKNVLHQKSNDPKKFNITIVENSKRREKT